MQHTSVSLSDNCLLTYIIYFQVMKVYQIDFVASRNQIYWSDSDMNAVKRANLSASTVKTLIDTGNTLVSFIHYFLLFFVIF